jgi:1,4-dihydroxy-2-naphthoate octaprenyltransferase
VWIGTAVVLALGCAGGIYLAAISGWVVIAIGAAAIVALLAYTGGPWPYGYHGLGELFVFGFFGPAAVVGSRYVHDATIPADAWLLAIPVGLLVTAILVVNNVRDLETDRAAGKRTLAVLIGRAPTRVLFAVLVLGAFALIGGLAGLEVIDHGALIALTALPLAIGPIRAVATETAGEGLVAALKATARLHLVVGLLLAAGLALS